MILDKTQLSLLDEIETDKFGTIRFFTVDDLLKVGEDTYNKMIASYSVNKSVYNLTDEYRNFDLLFLKFSDGGFMCFEDGKRILDCFIMSLCLIYNIERKDIVVSENTLRVLCNTKYGVIEINRDNFDEFSDIVLATNMSKRQEPEEEIKFKEGTSEARKKQFLEWIEYEKKQAKKKADSMSMIANMVMAKLKLYGDKETLRAMTIYNLLFAYSSEFAIEGYNKVYKQYLAGADTKKLDMKHWSEKIREIINK